VRQPLSIRPYQGSDHPAVTELNRYGLAAANHTEGNRHNFGDLAGVYLTKHGMGAPLLDHAQVLLAESPTQTITRAAIRIGTGKSHGASTPTEEGGLGVAQH